jgi:hypothetical protein
MQLADVLKSPLENDPKKKVNIAINMGAAPGN